MAEEESVRSKRRVPRHRMRVPACLSYDSSTTGLSFIVLLQYCPSYLELLR
jgi:hypothetical protein